MDELSDAVQGKRVSITLLYGPRYYAPIRYVALFVKTLLLLFQVKPDVVYAQNPPIFCPFTCLFYCRLAGKRLLVDHHSVWRVKTVGGPVGRVIGFLEKFVASSAYANTAPNSEWASQLSRMGGRRVELIHDYVPRNPNSRDDTLRHRYSQTSVIAIAAHGGHPLERIETEAAAAGQVGKLTLLISGPEEKLKRRLASAGLPPNVKYLGFLPRSEYERLKASCDLAINVTVEPNTLSHVLFEFAASQLPTITSRQSVVEEVFGDTVEYLETNRFEEVAGVLKRFTDDEELRATFRARMQRKHLELTKLHEEELARLRALLSNRQTLNIVTGEASKRR
jgi:glycosyltransferase involved in cell wall biosynthesis